MTRVKGPVRQLALEGLIGTAGKRIVHGAQRQLDDESETGVRRDRRACSGLGEFLGEYCCGVWLFGAGF